MTFPAPVRRPDPAGIQHQDTKTPRATKTKKHLFGVSWCPWCLGGEVRVWPAILAVLTLAGCGTPPVPTTLFPPVPLTAPPGGRVEPAAPLRHEPVDSVAARINGEVITWFEIDKEIETQIRQMEEQERDLLERQKKKDSLRRNHLRRAVEERLFRQKAKEFKIDVDEDYVEKRVQEEIRTRAGGDLEKYRQMLLENRGITIEKYRDEIRMENLRNEVIGRVLGIRYRDMVTPEEVRAFWARPEIQERFEEKEDATFAQIALPFRNPFQRTGAKVEAESIHRHLKEGAHFPAMASMAGDARNAVVNGARRKDLPPALSLLVFDQLREQEFSDVVEIEGSFRIVYLVRKRQERRRTFGEAQDEIIRELTYAKLQNFRESVRNQLVRENDIWPADLFGAGPELTGARPH